MFLKKRKEREFRMLWEVEKDGRRSLLMGTAHFFPYSFRKAFSRIMGGTRTVLFEGPLDEKSMAKVVRAGTGGEGGRHLLDHLDEKTAVRIMEAIMPAGRTRCSFMLFNLRVPGADNPVYEMIKGMKPWLAFFTLWSHYLERRGWKYSVDLEAHGVAGELGKHVLVLETIEEQIEVLENLSLENILRFLEQVDRWDVISDAYAQSYLQGDLEGIKIMGFRFPSRHRSVIDRRDQVFFERAGAYLEEGDALLCVGAPHILGLCRLLTADGYRCRQVVNPEG